MGVMTASQQRDTLPCATLKSVHVAPMKFFSECLLFLQTDNLGHNIASFLFASLVNEMLQRFAFNFHI